MKEQVSEVIEYVNDWQREVFPDATFLSIKNHLLREIAECYSSYKNFEPDSKRRDELADVIILVIGLVGRCPEETKRFIKHKMEINFNRKWGKADEHGVIEHIKEPT